MGTGYGEGRVVRYRWLLRAYPARFRERFGDGMTFAFSRDLAEARARGRFHAVLFWLHAAASTVFHGLSERLRPGRATPGSPIDEDPRSGRGEPVLGSLRELRHAGRRLARQPGFAVAGAVTIALGIGVTTALFSVVDGVLLKPLSYPEASRVVRVGHRSASSTLGMPAAGYYHYLDHSRTLTDLAVYIESSAPITGLGEPLELGIIQATPSLFTVLRIRPLMGRLLTEADAEPGAPPVCVVTWGFWQRQMGGDPHAVGKPVLEGEDLLVVGVLPREFSFQRPRSTVVFGNRVEVPDIILPLEMPDPAGLWFGNFMYQGIGRLAGSFTAEDASRELTSLMYDAAEAFPGAFTRQGLQDGQYRVEVQRLTDAMVGSLARVLWILLGAVGFVLLIATLNVANLFMVRVDARRGEMAVRRALGARGGTLARSILAESVLLALVGGVLGVALAAAGTGVLLRLVPPSVPRLDQVAVDYRTLLVAGALSVAAGLLFGLVPMLRALSTAPGAALGQESRGGTANRRTRRVRSAFVVVQVAFALVLLVGSGLLLRTFANLRNVDPGFDPTSTLTLKLSLSGNVLRAAGFDDDDGAMARSRFMLQVTDRVAAIPGVVSASFAADLPLDGGEYYDYVAVEGDVPQDLESGTKALREFMGPGYLEAIGARLIRGRELQRQDFAGYPHAVVVSQTFAEERWPGRSPLGERIVQYFPGLPVDRDIWYTVVGVVQDIRETDLTEPAVPTVYLPTVFLPDGGFAMWVPNLTLLVRTRGDPLGYVPRVREEIRAVQSEVPITNIETLAQLTADSFQEINLAAILLAVASIISVALGVVGVYGTVAYLVRQRTREIGVRIALGASPGAVRRMVLAQAAAVALLGIALGVLGVLAAGRILESMLFGVTADDLLIQVTVALGLFLVVLGASFIPARQAAAVDPAHAMRVE